MTHLLVLALGWFLGVVWVTVALRAKVQDLDNERLQLDLDRRNLRASQRAVFDLTVRHVLRDNPPLQFAAPAARKSWLH